MDIKGLPNGLFGRVSPGLVVRFAHITDGLSQTAAFGERVKGIGDFDNGSNNAQRDGMKPTAVGKRLPDRAPWPNHAACAAQSPGDPLTALASDVRPLGAYWHSGHPFATRYNHVMPPTFWSCAYDGITGGGAYTASSRHAGVVNVLVADGHARSARPSACRSGGHSSGTRSGARPCLRTSSDGAWVPAVS